MENFPPAYESRVSPRCCRDGDHTLDAVVDELTFIALVLVGFRDNPFLLFVLSLGQLL